MGISSIAGMFMPVGAGATAGAGSGRGALGAGSSMAADEFAGAAKEFMDYMQKPVAQRIQEAWLKKHGITPEEFAAMPPEEQQALLDKMRQELEEKMKELANSGGSNEPTIDVLV